MSCRLDKYNIICLINAATSENIPLENFLYIKHASLKKYIITLHQSQSELDKFLKQNFYDFDPKPFGIKNNKLIKFLYLFNKIIKKINPNLIHAHHTKAILLGIISRIFFRIPLFITVHSNFNYYKYYQKFIIHIACLISDIIICNSQSTQKSLPIFINSNKIHIIYNGVNFSKINQFTCKETSSFIVGTVCRMIPAKDLETLLRGFHLFLSKSKYNNSFLVLIGDGPERQKLSDLAQELSIQDNIIFKGELGREDVYRELGKLDVFVVSSIYEGFCNAMVEAAGAGLPVVATNIEPLPEVIGKDNARFFPIGDSQTLGEILKELQADPNERERLGRVAREHVISRYSLEASAAKHAELYKNFLQSRNI